MQTNPVKAIRAYCLSCVGWSANEVKLCPCTDCELYAFRFGKNPYRKPKTQEQLEQARQAAISNFGKNRSE